jgi:hypothetical protein
MEYINIHYTYQCPVGRNSNCVSVTIQNTLSSGLTHRQGILHNKSIVSFKYRGADKSLARPTSLSTVFSVQGTGGSSTGPDPENRVDDPDTGSPDRSVSSGLQVPGEPFPSWSG